MKRTYKIALLLFTILVNAQEAGKIGELLKNEASISEMNAKVTNRNNQTAKTRNNNELDKPIQNTNTVNREKTNIRRVISNNSRRKPHYNWNQNFGYSEVFIRIPEGGYFTIEVDQQMIGTASGKFRFFDLPAGRIPISIYENGFLLYRTYLNVRNNSRMILDFFTDYGLYLLQTVPLGQQIYGFNEWDDIWNNPYNGINGSIGNDFPSGNVMNHQDFNQFLNALKRNSYDNSRLKMIQQQVQGNDFTSEQIKALMKQFSFDSGKIEAGKILYPTCIDPQNFYIVYEIFSFDSSRNQLMDFVQNFRR